ncbi:hypothetical protein K461DRAFT_112791 [Myriangium duriaei CBS 260.36]|uniref:Uncharacterized protein n=1 Tax=Myriangium duriaei CBS 260.36 TaxID=1168546 RepID=A0A9P4J8I0_9PEZI|nr:hypothetical protein K461DRAFT_112791 [Myriangium duriaei CBS 260.36]
MHFLPTLLVLSTATLISAAPAPSPPATKIPPPPSPFVLEHIFTGILHLGPASKPITTPGGVLVTEAITSGTVTGKAINATVQGGFAHPAVYSNGTVQSPVIDAYGVTEDGLSFYLHEEGVGTPQAQVSRIVGCIGLEIVVRGLTAGRN